MTLESLATELLALGFTEWELFCSTYHPTRPPHEVWKIQARSNHNQWGVRFLRQGGVWMASGPPPQHDVRNADGAAWGCWPGATLAEALQALRTAQPGTV